MVLIITLIACISTLLIGLFVIWKDRKSATNLLFAVFCLALFCWSIANYYALQNLEPVEILFWMRLVMALAVIQCISFLLFIHTFPSRKIHLKKSYLIGLLVLGVLTSIVSFTPLLFRDVLLEDGQRSQLSRRG